MIAGKLCIEVKPTDKIAFISEFLCIGCGICVKKCVYLPLEAASYYVSVPLGDSEWLGSALTRTDATVCAQ